MRKRKAIFAGAAGLGSAFCFAAGRRLDVDYSLQLTEKGFYLEWLLWGILLGGILYGIWTAAEKCGKTGLPTGRFVQKAAAFEGKIRWWMIVLFLLVMWTPVWLSLFPGAFSYDAYDEWKQVQTGAITSHHPVLHVLLLGGLTEGVYQLTGSYNGGIALYVFLQMVLLALTFAYAVHFLRERAVAPVLRLFAILFFACSPVVQLFSICGTKDILFGAAFLLFVISLFRVCTDRERFFANKGWQVLFCVSALLSMILRKNGFYAAILTLLILVPLCSRNWKRYLGLFLVILAVYGLYVGPFYGALQVIPGGKQEMLSVPLQQLARVHRYERSVFSPEELEYLYRLVPEKHWEQYRSTVADFVKSGFQQAVYEEDPGAFWTLWACTGVKKPLTYLNSFLIGTVDYWYPFAIVDGYQGPEEKSSFFDYRVAPPGEERVFLTRLHDIYERISWDKEAQKKPGMFLLLSPGWYFLLYALLVCYVWYRRLYRRLVPLVAIALYFCTLLLGPIALVRYVLILYYVLPIYSVFLPEPERNACLIREKEVK